ncbi:MAG TPA: hypothetical protein VKY26_13155, partial [Actinomycetota bacterium]|nr:hypothetical protein [Actinomycetota bacterium]
MSNIAARELPPAAGGHPDPADELVAFALGALPALRLPSGLYCHEQAFGGQTAMPVRESSRYSLMVLIGYLRATEGGHPVDVDLEALFARCLERRAQFTAGDVGLALWADARLGGAAIAGLLDDLERRLPDARSLDRLLGMELAWLVIGLCHAGHRSAGVVAPFLGLLEHLRSVRQAPSGLYYHDNASLL